MHGVDITRDQMARWMTNQGPLILPLKALLHSDLLKSVRREKSASVVAMIRELWLDRIEQIPAKSLTGKGLHYLKNQWDQLTAFLDEPRLPIDNNYVERQVKHLATGRKSWLFCDTVAGVEAAAAFFYAACDCQRKRPESI